MQKHTLNISTDLQLPQEVGTETIAILGRRGSGKSNTATVIAEELIRAGQQVVVIDPKGEAWGLKAQGDGGPGLDVIVFGDPQGDLPLRDEHGPVVADFVVSGGKSCVLSVKGLVSDAAQRRFVARFAERLFELKGRPGNSSPLMVIIDEAHLFVPQRIDPGQADVVSRLQRLVRLGRSSGIGVTLVDQRPASVNKDVLTQLEVMICHQLTGPHDRRAVDDWIEANADREQAAEFRRSLPTLDRGEAWVWSPALLKVFKRVKVRHAMHTGTFQKFAGEVESDETYVGGKAKNMHRSRRQEKIKGTGGVGKAIVHGILERGAGKDGCSKVKATVVPNAKGKTLTPIVRDHVETGAHVYTDALKSYNSLAPDYVHAAVDHAVRYVDGAVHTNGMENFWALFKRCIHGTYVSVDEPHLQRYVDEEVFRFNERQLNDGQRFDTVLPGVIGKRLTYKMLTGQTQPMGQA